MTENNTETLELPAEEAGEAPTYDVGDMVFAREDVRNASVDLGKVVSTTEGKLVLHCWGTRGATFKSTKWTPVFIDKDRAVLLHKPRGRSGAAPWIWELDSNDTAALISPLTM